MTTAGADIPRRLPTAVGMQGYLIRTSLDDDLLWDLVVATVAGPLPLNSRLSVEPEWMVLAGPEWAAWDPGTDRLQAPPAAEPSRWQVRDDRLVLAADAQTAVGSTLVATTTRPGAPVVRLAVDDASWAWFTHFLESDDGPLDEAELLAAITHRVAEGLPTGIDGHTPEPSPPISRAAVRAAESRAGFPFPDLLVRVLTEVAASGVGPGYGLLGADAQRDDDGRLLLCDWGCGITSWLQPDGTVVGHDPNAGPDDLVLDDGRTLTEWLRAWVNDDLFQPWAVQDPSTGAWRAATPAEHRASLAEAEGW
ncbi:hypothetical protein [Myceligenerans crystallogenes]|uniref:hypothetical protein n=1 Tax=Myceligenerans crystallogenes TaxID=316335 RepID=UPI0031D520BD